VHEAIFRAHLDKFGVHVELSTELVDFAAHSDHVEATIAAKKGGNTTTEMKKYDFLVGSDGAHSIIRKKLGCTFLGETRDAENLVVGDIDVKVGLSNDVSSLSILLALSNYFLVLALLG
jgi:2-polyprenyl-6-methoxyphenol hydroxylase-like FAD-dependent oxidoreductase